MAEDTVTGPARPGDVLRRRLLEAKGITQEELADAMKVSRYSVNQLINNRRSITADMALRLGAVTNTSAEFWLNLQRAVDLFEAERRLGDQLRKMQEFGKRLRRA